MLEIRKWPWVGVIAGVATSGLWACGAREGKLPGPEADAAAGFAGQAGGEGGTPDLDAAADDAPDSQDGGSADAGNDAADDATEAGCTADTLDCDSDPSNGCETPADWENCGSCKKVCSTVNATPQCVSGTCQLACFPGFADCDGTADNGCEADLNSAPANCGYCAHTCGTAGCTKGLCGLQTLASGLNPIDAIALDDSSVYYAFHSEGIVARVAKQGGTPVTLADAQGAYMKTVAVSGGMVYFGASSLKRVPVSGGAVETLATNQGMIQGIAVRDGFVYWTGGGGYSLDSPGTVSRLPITGGTPMVLIDNFSPTPAALAVDATHVYWTADGYSGFVSKVPVAGGANNQLFSGQKRPRSIVVEAAMMYWANLAGDRIWKAGSDGSNPTQIAQCGLPGSLSVDNGAVYWTCGDSIMTLQPGAAAPQTFASGLLSADALAIDATHVYWFTRGTGNADGEIARALR
jgi:hypothetical protein